MALIGEDVECDNCTFPICWQTDSCTKDTSYATASWLGNPANQNFSVVDTPGFEDSDDEMAELLEEMITVLNEEVKSANAIVLTMDSSLCRWTDGLTEMLGQLEALFGRKMWNNTIVEMSKFSFAEDKIKERNDTCNSNPSHCQDETFWYNEINRQLQDRFNIGIEVPLVFIDSWATKYPDHQSQQEHFISETNKLWDFAMNHTGFAFKGIDEVLQENEEMRRELDWLNDEVTKNITELQQWLQGNMSDIQGQIDAESTNRKTKDQDIIGITDDLTSDLTEETKNRKEMDSLLQQNMLPIGSIIAWVLKPDKNSGNETYLPDGWMRCDGTTIPPPSIWAGSTTPDLNGEKHFLRGGSDLEYLDTEMDQIQDLELTLSDPGHSHSESGHSHDDIEDRYYETYQGCYGEYGSDFYGGTDHHWLCKEQSNSDHSTWWQYAHHTVSTEHITIASSKASISLQTSSYRKGDETRPINTKVIWIIRVW